MNGEKDLGSQAGTVPESLTSREQFEELISELNSRRHEAGDAHRKYMERSNSAFADLGSTDVYALSNQIEGAVELAKRQGLVPQDAKLTDFLK